MIEASVAQAHLAGLVRDFAGLLDTADPAAPVPACPGWSVTDLAQHLGRVHLWAAGRLGARVSVPAPEADQSSLAAWYRACAAGLLEALRSTDPAAVVDTFEEPGPAGFWSRRQAHETAVHRWDLGAAVGRDVGYDAELAVDGIDEVVTMFFPRQVRLGRIAPLSTALALAPDGQPRTWVLAGDGTGPVVDAALEVSGPAETLLLAVWGRVGLQDPRLHVRGDRDAAAGVLGSGIVP